MRPNSQIMGRIAGFTPDRLDARFWPLPALRPGKDDKSHVATDFQAVILLCDLTEKTWAEGI